MAEELSSPFWIKDVIQEKIEYKATLYKPTQIPKSHFITIFMAFHYELDIKSYVKAPLVFVKLLMEK